MRIERVFASLLVVLLLAGQAFAVGAKRAAYVGGTHPDLNRRKDAPEGKLDVGDAKALTFSTPGTTITIPYDRITALEYQRAAKYRTTTLGNSGNTTVVIVPPVAILALPFSPRKKHFLTIAYRDAEGNAQAVVLELGKEIEQSVRASLAARTGKQINVIVD